MKYLDFLRIIYGKAGKDLCLNVLEDENISRCHNFEKYHIDPDIPDYQWFVTYCAGRYSTGEKIFRIALRYESTERPFYGNYISDVHRPDMEFSSTIVENEADRIYLRILLDSRVVHIPGTVMAYTIVHFHIPISELFELTDEEFIEKYSKVDSRSEEIFTMEVFPGVSPQQFELDVLKRKEPNT